MELAQDVPGWRHKLEAGCMELAQNILDRGGWEPYLANKEIEKLECPPKSHPALTK